VMKAILAVSDKVLVLHQGKVLTSGDPKEVLADPRVIEAYLGHRYAKRRGAGQPEQPAEVQPAEEQPAEEQHRGEQDV
jgi:ABC-type hemin transport system ATPase subunit